MYIKDIQFKRKAAATVAIFSIENVANNFQLAGAVRDACKHLSEGGTAKHTETVQCRANQAKGGAWVTGILVVSVERDGDNYPTDCRFTGAVSDVELDELITSFKAQGTIKLRPSQADLLEPVEEHDPTTQGELAIPPSNSHFGDIHGSKETDQQQEKGSRKKTASRKKAGTNGRGTESRARRTNRAGGARKRTTAGKKRTTPPRGRADRTVQHGVPADR